MRSEARRARDPQVGTDAATAVHPQQAQTALGLVPSHLENVTRPEAGALQRDQSARCRGTTDDDPRMVRRGPGRDDGENESGYEEEEGQGRQPVAKATGFRARLGLDLGTVFTDPVLAIPEHEMGLLSATRLATRAPWLCGPASRRVCYFEEAGRSRGGQPTTGVGRSASLRAGGWPAHPAMGTQRGDHVTTSHGTGPPRTCIHHIGSPARGSTRCCRGAPQPVATRPARRVGRGHVRRYRGKNPSRASGSSAGSRSATSRRYSPSSTTIRSVLNG